MKLRTILFVLALLAFLSASIGGYLYYSSLKESAYMEAERQAASEAKRIRNGVSSYLSENQKAAKALAGLRELQHALERRDGLSLAEANSVLDLFQTALKVSVCYLMDSEGNTIASSNRNAPDSFVGKNYGFRPYFQQAIHGTPAVYMALGVTSKKRGVYYSHPVYGQTENGPTGAVVIKASVESMRDEFTQNQAGIALLTDPNGVIFVSSRDAWLYHVLWQISPEQASQIAETRQFGRGPWDWTGMRLKDQTHAVDQSGDEYLIYQMKVTDYQGWNVIYLVSLRTIHKSVIDPLIKSSGTVILILCILIGLSVFLLYREASHDIVKRRMAEEALRESETNYRAIFNAASDAIFVHDIETGDILDVNQKMCDLYGYTPEEIRDLNVEALSSGESPYTQDHALQWIRKAVEGEPQLFEWHAKEKNDRLFWVEVNLRRATIGGRDRLLAVVRDISERKQGEEALRESERKFRAITGTAADAIILMDNEGKISYWNPAAERMFGHSPEEAIGQELHVFLAPEEYHETYRGGFGKFRETGEGPVVGKTAEFLAISKDGSQFPIEVSTSALNIKGKWHAAGIIRDISERKRVEYEIKKLNEELEQRVIERSAELYESEQRHRSLLESSPDPIVVYDMDGKVTYLNPAFSQTFGWSLEELLGKWIDFVPEENWPETREAIDRMLQGEQVQLFETNRLTKDGEILNIQLSTSLFQDREGKTAGNIVILRDVTVQKQAEEALRNAHDELERRVAERTAELVKTNEQLRQEIEERTQAEEALRESEERFRTTFRVAPLGIAIAHPEGKFIDVNKSFQQMLGYTREEVTKMTFVDITHPDDRDITTKLVDEILEGKRDFYETEKRYLRKDGQHVWAIVRATAVKDKKGEIEYWLGIIEDITQRKRAEEELIRLGTAVEQAAESVIIADRPGTILYVNPAFERLSGFSREEIVGQNFRVLKSDRHDEAFYKRMWNIISRGEIWSGRINNRMKDGTLREFETTISPVRDNTGRILNFVSVNRDVTQEVELEAQLFQAQKMEAVGTLAGGIAHDFNNLLQVVQGYSEVLMRGLSQSGSRYRALQKIHHSSKRGAELTRQLLTFSRKVESQELPLDLNHAVEQVKRLLERTIPKMIDIELHLEKEPWIVNADPVQVEQALMNLAVNAKDAMPEGGRLVFETENVTLDEAYCRTHLGVRPGKYMLLNISDSGHGMDKETLEHVFEPFYTTKEVGKGTGLGLSMVYGIVQNHNGYITCYSSQGVGTTFKIYLPVIEGEGEDREVEEMEVAAVGGSETILLVDDEELIRELGVELLGDAGYTVLTASGGENALEIYQQEKERIDLIILDLILPGIGGRKCLEELLSTNPRAKVIIASGYSANGPMKETMEAGAKGYISKPFDVGHMLKVVREVLDQD